MALYTDIEHTTIRSAHAAIVQDMERNAGEVSKDLLRTFTASLIRGIFIEGENAEDVMDAGTSILAYILRGIEDGFWNVSLLIEEGDVPYKLGRAAINYTWLSRETILLMGEAVKADRAARRRTVN